MNAKYSLEFKTKIELGIEMMKRFVSSLRYFRKEAKVTAVADGAYATKELIHELEDLGVPFVSRLRSNAKLFDLPGPRQPGQRGRNRKYGTHAISLSKEAQDKKGWEKVIFQGRGGEVTREFKTFLATTRIATESIRVVLVRFETGEWAAYFSTDTNMTVEEILEIVDQRWAIEECFHDLKEVWKASQQQVRNLWSNIGCWNLNTIAYAMTELECWDQSHGDLVDRSGRLWDNPDRRPSHADKRRWIAGKMLRESILKELPPELNSEKWLATMEQILALAT